MLHGLRDPQLREIRAEQVEGRLDEGEDCADADVRCIDVEQGALPGREIRERRASEHLLVVDVDRHIAAGIGREDEPHQLERAQQAQRQVGHEVVAQEAVFEVVENALAVKPVVGRREAPPGYGADERNLVEEARPPAADRDLGISQLLQDPVREGGRPGTASREREDDAEFAAARRTPWADSVALARPVLRERLVLDAGRGAAEAEAGREEKNQESVG